MSKYNIGDTINLQLIVDDKQHSFNNGAEYWISVERNDTSDGMWLTEEQLDKYSAKTYEQGLEDGRNDAWELARKVTIPAMYGGLGAKECIDIFGENIPGMEILRKYSVQETLQKLEAYEKEQEIKVGDVVSCTETKGTAVVAKKPTDNEIYILWNDGSTGRHNIEDFKKTGKHIDISSILEQIKE